MSSVVLKCIGKDGEPTAMIISTSLGDGVEKKFVFEKKNGFQASVPTQLSYKRKLTGEQRVSHDNYAQFLLDAYKDETQGFHFELVEIVEVPVVVEPIRKRKKKHEEVAE